MNFCIMDLEWTSWCDNEIKQIDSPKKEIIQMSFLVFNYTTMKKIKDINLYIRPKFNPILSSHIKKLTGIKQDFIETEGIDFKYAFQIFIKNMNDLNVKKILSNGQDGDILDQNCIYHKLSLNNKLIFLNLKNLFTDFFDLPIDAVQSNNLHRLINDKNHKIVQIHDSCFDVTNIYEALFHIKKKEKTILDNLILN